MRLVRILLSESSVNTLSREMDRAVARYLAKDDTERLHQLKHVIQEIQENSTFLQVKDVEEIQLVRSPDGTTKWAPKRDDAGEAGS